jgi:hypothetical protein
MPSKSCARGIEYIFVPRRKDYDLVNIENVRRMYSDAYLI